MTKPIAMPIFHHAYFVEDIDASVEHWESVFGAGPFFFAREHQTDEFMYRGTDTQALVSYAFGHLGDGIIQFIQQHDDKPSIYTDMYGPGEFGYHHFGVLVEDFDKARQYFLDKGYVNATELFSDGARAAYFDTRKDNGAFTEIHDVPPPQMAEGWAEWRTAHEAARDLSKRRL